MGPSQQFCWPYFLCFILLVIVRFSVDVCDRCVLDIYENTEQIASCIGSIWDAAFNCQLKDDSIFYGTVGNPSYSKPLNFKTNQPYLLQLCNFHFEICFSMTWMSAAWHPDA